ncbi:MAG: PAS domain S-box protein [Rhodocyclaceae bacterium]|nr:PAS domain S-box protein [Rhodocyclaceae bacterium]
MSPTSLNVSDNEFPEPKVIEENEDPSFYRLIFDASPKGHVVLNRDGVIVLANKSLLTIFGLTREVLVGRPFEEFISARSRAVVRARLLACVDCAFPCDSDGRVEFFGVRADGSEVLLDLTLGNVKTENGCFLVCAIRDLTRTRVIEDELRKLNRRDILALGASNIGVWDWDVDRNILVWEKEMFALYGAPNRDLEQAHETWKKALHPEDASRVQEALRHALKSREKFEAEFRIIWPDGSVREIRSVATVSSDEDGSARRMTGVNIDVTEQNALSREVSEKTKSLESSNSDLEHFAFAASHDLQEPLRKIISFSDILESSLEPETGAETKRILAVITKSAARMKVLIEDLLKYSRVGRKDWQTTFVDLNAVVALTLDTLESRTAECQGVISVDKLPVVTGDKTHLTLLFQNLIGNALKFRREGTPPRVDISCRKKGEDWEFWVKDNGIGIDAQYREKIFLLFARLHGRAKYEGTGIGLSMCRRTVEKLGGKIWVDADPDSESGSIFKFTLPILVQPVKSN